MEPSILIFAGCALAILGLLNQLRLRRRGAWRRLGPAAAIRSSSQGRLSSSDVRGGDSSLMRLVNAAVMTVGLGLVLAAALAG